MLHLKLSRKWIFLTCVLLSFVATAGAIKTWGTSDNLTAADLNANFQHIHNLMVGGHGARLIDADVNASANISQSKLSNFRVLPVAWANVHVNAGVPGSGPCTGTCAITANGFSGATRSGAGNYLVTFSPARTDSTYVSMVTAHSGLGGTCYTCGYAAGTVNVCCATSAGVAADGEFDVAVFDDN